MKMVTAIVKPFKLDEIEAAVDRAISRHQQLAARTQTADPGTLSADEK